MASIFVAQDQENFVHGQQTAAAAKPLNQGINRFGSKTPSNKPPKTPFKLPHNDENAAFRAGKSVLKTNGKGHENVVFGGKKGGDVDKNAFITPAGPRNRAPLGMKTTNARGKAFQTPAPPTEKRSVQATSPRLRRAKVKVHQAEDTTIEAQEEEPEIEYMPPRSIPLPDYPDDIHEMTYPMFEGANLMRGWYDVYADPIGDDGISRWEREEAEDRAKWVKIENEMIQKAIDEMPLIGYDVPEYPGAETVLSIRRRYEEEAKKLKDQQQQTTNPSTSVDAVNSTRKPAVPRKPLSTLTSKSAAAALSQPTKSVRATTKPDYAAPTAATKAKAPSATALPLSRRKPASATAPTNPSTTRHTAATAASRSTLGYSKGRAVSSTSRSLRSPPTANAQPADPRKRNNGSTVVYADLRHGAAPPPSTDAVGLGLDLGPGLGLGGGGEEAHDEEVDEDADVEECMRGYLPLSLLRDESVMEEFVLRLE
ncbi:hypothetical protein B0A49_09889 [Cryomyces minteri]|uniref:Uncharacterized protein n=1 Tax=Cryomyces minteri TaxID=331657 RepID=A0A4U0W7J6_9PEZI|nr:hypothetical protein B0A49_09889 [Cryomyces minteri]